MPRFIDDSVSDRRRARTGRRFTPMVVAIITFALINVGVGVGMQNADVPASYGREWGDELAGTKAVLLADLDDDRGISGLFVGASVVDSAVDPDVLGTALVLDRPVFVAGLNGASTSLLAAWSKALVHLVEPSVVFIGLGPGDLSALEDSRVNQLVASPAYRRLVGSAPCRTTNCQFGRALDDVEHSMRWLPVLAYRWNIRELKFGVPMTSLGRDTVYGDTVMTPTNTPLPAPARPMVGEPTIMPDAAVQSFGEMIDTFEAAGITVVLLKMPISATRAQGFGGQQDPRYEATLLQLAKLYALTVVSVDERLGFVDEYFADGLHMNATGARAFSEALALELAEAHPEIVERLRSSDRVQL